MNAVVQTDGVPQGERRRRQRLKLAWTLIIGHGMAHAFNSAFLLVCIQLGQFTWSALFSYLGLVSIAAVAGGLILLKLPRAHLDWPTRALIQLALGTIPPHFAAYWLLSSPARSAFAIFTLLPLFGSLLWLGGRHLLKLTALLAACQFLEWLALRVWSPERQHGWGELITVAACAAAGVQLAYLAERIFVMNERLRQRTRELDETVGAIDRMARIDELTGCHNRRHLLEQLDAAVLRRREPQGSAPPPLAVMLLDLDHFKRINDTHGHGAGDEVLRRFAACVSAGIPPDAVFGRHGGEEFVLLLPDRSEAEVRRQAEALRAAVEALDLQDVVPGGPVTCSIGVALAQGDEDSDALLGSADQALYQAKAGGRNRVVLRSAPPRWATPAAARTGPAPAVRVFAQPMGEPTRPASLSA